MAVCVEELARAGIDVHVAEPAETAARRGPKRRAKPDLRDAADLADLLRIGRLPEAWIAPPATRELRGWVRHRAKLVGLRSNLKCQVHAVIRRQPKGPRRSTVRTVGAVDEKSGTVHVPRL